MQDVLRFDRFRLNLQDDDGKQYNLLDDISFSVREGRALGIVGESGCGKSITTLSAMRLLPPVAKVAGGRILLGEEDLLQKTEQEMYKIRGKELSMIFQEPMTALNPVLTIGFQIEEVLRRHEKNLSKKDLRERTISLLQKVGIPNPEKRIKNYPHQFSGGMRQRTMIAMAIACNPRVLIADEATTALDVTIQAQVLDLMSRLKTGGSLMFITHNLGVVAEVCDELVVMYAGQVMEKGTVEEVFLHPAHPYTRGLLKAIPTLTTNVKRLHNIPGTVPLAHKFEQGCRYAPRCEHCKAVCREKAPVQTRINDDHSVACFLETEVERT